MGRWRPPPESSTALITREGHARLKAELDELWRVRRPEVVKALAAAAAEGDRSENAEYTYLISPDPQPPVAGCASPTAEHTAT